MNDKAKALADLSPAEKRALLERMLREKMQSTTTVCPASHIQRGLWIVQEIARESPVYNVAFAARVHSPVDVAALQRSCQFLVDRHPALRTTFEVRDGELVQVIAGYRDAQVERVDASDWTEDELRQRSLAALQKPIDLARGPLFRVTLFTQAPAEHVLLIVGHHIMLDGWSIYLLLDELRTVYRAEAAGQRAVLPPIEREYSDFVRWEKEMLASPAGQEAWAYWERQLGGELPLLNLPLDRPRRPVETRRGASYRFELSAPLTRQLKALARAEGVTLFMVLLAGYQVLLSRYTGQDDIIVGTPVSGRTLAEFADVFGCFVNMIMLRADLSGAPTFRQFLGQVRRTVLDGLAHQDYPLRLLVEKLRPAWDRDHPPFAQTEFALQKPHRFSELSNMYAMLGGTEVGRIDFGGLDIEHYYLPMEEGLSDLHIEMAEAGDRLAGEIKYNPDIMDEATIARMAAHFATLLGSFADNPDVQVSAAPLMSEPETRRLAVDWNATEVDFPAESGFARLFEAQVERTPGAVAVTCAGEQLTYRALNRRANGWAESLARQGLGRDRLVAILADRGLDFLTAILAAFKAGGAYLPLDPAYPVPRIRQILEQSQPCAVIVAENYRPLLEQALAESAVRPAVAGLADLRATMPRDLNPAPARAPGDLSYVIYTSGSTGAPKGAMLEQVGMVNHLFAKITDTQMAAGEVVAQNASQCFDVSVWQFLSALLVGGATCILGDEIAHDPGRLLDEVQAQGVTVLEVVPSMLRFMLEEIARRGESRPKLPALRWLVSAGEALPPESCRRWFEFYPSIPILNAYGPTECSVDATHYRLYQPPAADVINMPIGRPIRNMSVYVLDSHGQVAPIGVTGELYIGGVGVGRGYLRRPDLTAERFIQNPFVKLKPGWEETARLPYATDRLYKTGDLARYRPDGNIEFLGRADFQVKVRGFRIELAEIEAVLAQHSGVRETVVMARDSGPGDKQLVAYLTTQAGAAPAAAELRTWVKERLPDYMIPAAFVFLEAFPLSSNGKINRQRLPAPDNVRPELETSYVAPQDETQRRVAAIWQELLHVEKVGITDNFFELGGHSLLAVQVHTRLRQVFDTDLTVADMFRFSTVQALAAYLTSKSDQVSPLHAARDRAERQREALRRGEQRKPR